MTNKQIHLRTIGTFFGVVLFIFFVVMFPFLFMKIAGLLLVLISLSGVYAAVFFSIKDYYED